MPAVSDRGQSGLDGRPSRVSRCDSGFMSPMVDRIKSWRFSQGTSGLFVMLSEAPWAAQHPSPGPPSLNQPSEWVSGGAGPAV